MKKIFIICISLFLLLLLILNVEVTYKRGVNYKVSTERIPLLLKISNFYTRHLNYIHLVNKIVNKSDSFDEKMIKLMTWVQLNINPQPEELSVIDDHVWHIIIRRYGTKDQYCDVFSTLVNYLGLTSYYNYVYDNENINKYPFVFVLNENKVYIFDIYNGVYFLKSDNELASLEYLLTNEDWFLKEIKETKLNQKYENFLAGMQKSGLPKQNRSMIQSPFRRFIFEIKKLVN